MNPLDQLKDIHLPEAVSNWPPAWGWWLSAVLVTLVLALLTRWIFSNYRKKQAIREASSLLAQLDSHSADYPQQLNSLLKRLALSYFPRRNIAGLHQQEWLSFLSRQLPPKKQTEFETQYQLVLDRLYNPAATDVDTRQASELVQSWIKHALPPKKQEGEHV